MSFELLTGAMGLLGSAPGAAGAVWAGSVTKSQRQQTRHQLEAAQACWKLDNQRDIYLRLLTRAAMRQASSGELFNSLYDGASEEEKGEIHRRKFVRWQEFATISTTARLFTADTDARAATELTHDALLTLDRVSEGWQRGRGRSGRETRAAAGVAVSSP
ncbi:hypothetical protein [Streptomyces sp. WM6378]|uniref:hypothetical protein n=1 Tax=Streptomyces sp. WM6378 TaxID=1415557 RepID=UPI00131B1AD3|nr:hypothetical protein [Streptomyces sp. WM6378]